MLNEAPVASMFDLDDTRLDNRAPCWHAHTERGNEYGDGSAAPDQSVAGKSSTSIGPANFRAMLAGFRAMDANFRSTSMDHQLQVLSRCTPAVAATHMSTRA